jgi:5'(3')-deoxyribonucleotidase
LKIENSILKVLVYFDIFNYPLTKKEIASFLDQPFDQSAFNDALAELVRSQYVFQLHEFYSLKNDHSLAERRKKGNQLAMALLPKAQKIANLLYKFPYVRAVGISGSVSKNFADENADIDYFIVTKANRLWIARTLLHLFKKNPFLKNRHVHYCMNYFLDEDDMLIEEKNVYTATELYTIIPMAGNGSMENFFRANAWSFSYFPNRDLPTVKEEIKRSSPWFKKLAESVLNNRLGDSIDNYLLNLTTRRWKKKEDEKRLNIKGERMGLKTGKHFSKPNPIFFHDWFMAKYEKNLEQKKREWRLVDYVENHF